MGNLAYSPLEHDEKQTASQATPPTEATIEELVAVARGLRTRLRAEQAEAEKRSYPSREIYELFRSAGFFRIMTPKRFGGYEMRLRDFYRLVMEIAQGCPSTGWWYALGAAHVVQICSYFPESAQVKILGQSPDFSAPWSFNSPDYKYQRVEGGWNISGTWYFSSGIPHAPYFMAGGELPPEGEDATGSSIWQTPTLSFVIPSHHVEMLHDWGSIIGMKASGSNSGRVAQIFVPDEMTIIMNRAEPISGKTRGGAIHANPLYNGLMNGFVEGGLAAMAAGTCYAAIDAFVELINRRTVGSTNQLRAHNRDYQRALGLALANADAAKAIVVQGAENYHLHSEAAMRGEEPFSLEKGLRMDGAYHLAEQMVWNTISELCRNAGSGALRDGQFLQRYWRDIITLCTRTGQLDHRASDIAIEHFANMGIDIR